MSPPARPKTPVTGSSTFVGVPRTRHIGKTGYRCQTNGTGQLSGHLTAYGGHASNGYRRAVGTRVSATRGGCFEVTANAGSVLRTVTGESLDAPEGPYGTSDGRALCVSLLLCRAGRRSDLGCTMNGRPLTSASPSGSHSPYVWSRDWRRTWSNTRTPGWTGHPTRATSTASSRRPMWSRASRRYRFSWRNCGRSTRSSGDDPC